MRESDGRSPLKKPYCSPVDQCFNGMRGRRASLGESGSCSLTAPIEHNTACAGVSLATNGRLMLDGQRAPGLTVTNEAQKLDSIGTPVGPVAAAIMAIFVVLVIAVYAYRHQVTIACQSMGVSTRKDCLYR